METITHQKFSDKIKVLPEFLAEELSDFIDFLVYMNDKDWADSLTVEEKKSIEKGLKDIEEGNVFSHESVMEEMVIYRKSKQKQFFNLFV